jgi:hypothetical protein
MSLPSLPDNVQSSPISQEQPPMFVLQASIAVIPNDQFVNGVGMKHIEFDGVVGKISTECGITTCRPGSDMITRRHGIAGTLLCAGLHGTVVVVDILRVSRTAASRPTSWYLKDDHEWRYPVVDPDKAIVLTRSSIRIHRKNTHNAHWHLDDFVDGKVTIRQKNHCLFLVVHWLGVPGYDTTTAFNISGFVYC